MGNQFCLGQQCLCGKHGLLEGRYFFEVYVNPVDVNM